MPWKKKNNHFRYDRRNTGLIDFYQAIIKGHKFMMSKESKIADVFEHYTFQNTSTFTTFITVISVLTYIMGLPITP